MKKGETDVKYGCQKVHSPSFLPIFDTCIHNNDNEQTNRVFFLQGGKASVL
jgi:hypothetical protein